MVATDSSVQFKWIRPHGASMKAFSYLNDIFCNANNSALDTSWISWWRCSERYKHDHDRCFSVIWHNDVLPLFSQKTIHAMASVISWLQASKCSEGTHAGTWARSNTWKDSIVLLKICLHIMISMLLALSDARLELMHTHAFAHTTCIWFRHFLIENRKHNSMRFFDFDNHSPLGT